MQELLDRALTDPVSASQLLLSLTSASTVPQELLPRVVQFLATEAGPLQTRQNIFVVITAECDPELAPVKEAAQTLAALLVQTVKAGVHFYDNNALFRCLISLVSTPSRVISFDEVDELLIATCNYHRVVSLQLIDVCSKLQLISEKALPDVITMLCLCALESNFPLKVINVLLSGRLRRQCFKLVLEYCSDSLQHDRCCGAISLLAQTLWGSSRIVELSMSDALLNQLALLVHRGAIQNKIPLHMCSALDSFVVTLKPEDVAAQDQVAGIIEELNPSLQQDALLAPALSSVLSKLISFSNNPAVLDIAILHVRLFTDNQAALDALLKHQESKVHPSDPFWLDHLTKLMQSFTIIVLPEPIRHAAMLFVLDLVCRYRSVFADDILRHGVLPFRSSIDSFSEALQVSVRTKLGEIAGSMAEETFSDLLEIIRNGCNSTYCGVRVLSVGTLRVLFKEKLPHPTYEHCILVFDALFELIASHHDDGIRQRAIEAIAGISVANNGAIKFVSGDATVVSAYVFAGKRYYDDRTSTVLPLSKLMDALCDIVEKEPANECFDSALDLIRRFSSAAIIALEIDIWRLRAVFSQYLIASCCDGQSQPRCSKRSYSRNLLCFQVLCTALSYREHIDDDQYINVITAFISGIKCNASHFERPSSRLIVDLCLRALIVLALDIPQLISATISKLLILDSLQQQPFIRLLLQLIHSFLAGSYEYHAQVGRCWSSAPSEFSLIFRMMLKFLAKRLLDAFESRLAYRCLRISFLLCDFNTRIIVLNQVKDSLKAKHDDVEMVCLMDFIFQFLHSDSCLFANFPQDNAGSNTPDRPVTRSCSWATPTSIITISSLGHSLHSDVSVRCVSAPNAHYTFSDTELRTNPVENVADSPERVMNMLKILTGSVSSANATDLVGGHDLERSLAILDQIPCQETLKVGIVYVQPDQVDESDILNNATGSLHYQQILRCLGQPLVLKGTKAYTGGLDRHHDKDGRLSLAWFDPLTQICFHVATMIPNRATAARGEHKKRHIGNDFVNIIYNDNISCNYDPDTLSSQLNFVQIIIEHVVDDYFSIKLNVKPTVPEFWFINECRIFHLSILGQIIRQIIIQSQIACWTMQTQKSQNPAWQVRYQQIQRIAERHSRRAGNSVAVPQ